MAEKKNKTLKEKIKMIELRKSVKKSVREDMRKFYPDKTYEIIKNMGAVKKARREIF